MAKPRGLTPDRAQFLALSATDDAYLRTREGRTDVYLRGSYRMFASWLEGGAQPGVHLRADHGEKSTAFRGDHNWIHVATPDWAAIPDQLATSRTIAAKRGGGIVVAGKQDLYKPLAKAVAVATAPPTGLHAGGPRAKVLSGERALAVALCRACLHRLDHLRHDGDAATRARLTAMLGTSLRNEQWWPAANALPYGTEGAKRAADEAESPAVQLVRAAIGAENAGSQSCLPYVTKALVRAVRELERTEDAAAAAAFLVELDERIMRHELVAAIAAKTKTEPAGDPATWRVLWRGADAKGFPAWWLARLGAASYGVLGKLGGRWSWQVDTRDAAIATIPDEHFEAAVEIALARDV